MPEERPARELDKIMVRLPDGMRDRLAAEARANGRSVNAEVVARLEISLATPSAALRQQVANELKEYFEWRMERDRKLLSEGQV